ncbi:MAG TPA: ATPase, partial [Aquabacterium sp.]|nr:ATPase [Aquabacterium sp.]
MYETYFGFSSPPFLLNPDPSFYFDSKGHSSALSYLKFGLYQAEGFIVVTGDIGAGKTTLVRTLLSDIDTEKVVAAQLVSTQLEAGDLLRSAI